MKKIGFCRRLPKHHPVRLRNGECWLVEELLVSQKERFYQQVLVDSQWVNGYLKGLDKHDILYLAGITAPGELGGLCRRRWSIETLFEWFKGRGFRLETTHLQAYEKLKKLIVLVAIAFGFCLIGGRHYHQKVASIPRKVHGYRGNSFYLSQS